MPITSAGVAETAPNAVSAHGRSDRTLLPAYRLADEWLQGRDSNLENRLRGGPHFSHLPRMNTLIVTRADKVLDRSRSSVELPRKNSKSSNHSTVFRLLRKCLAASAESNPQSGFDIKIPAIFMHDGLEWLAKRFLLLRQRCQEPNEIMPPLDAAVECALFVRDILGHARMLRSFLRAGFPLGIGAPMLKSFLQGQYLRSRHGAKSTRSCSRSSELWGVLAKYKQAQMGSRRNSAS